MLFPCLCVQGLYWFSWPLHLILRFTAGRTWIKLWDRQQLGRPYSLVMAGPPSSNLSAIWKFLQLWLIEMRASPGCTSPCLRNTLVCSPAKTQFIPVVPNSIAFFPAPEEPRHHVYASCKCNPACLAQKPGSSAAPMAVQRIRKRCAVSVFACTNIHSSFIFPTFVTQKKLLAHFFSYVKLLFWGLMKPMNEWAGRPCVCDVTGAIMRFLSPAEVIETHLPPNRTPSKLYLCLLSMCWPDKLA